MLLISDETLDLIAGGTASGEASIPVVTVPGYVPPEGSGGGGGGGWLPPWGGGGGEGSGSAPQPDPPPPDCTPVHSSPVPANAPKDVDMNVLRNTMLDVANQINAMDKNIEHGAIVVRTSDGSLRAGAIAHGLPGEVEIPISVRPGEVIVGFIHSHPRDHINQTLPSENDFIAADTIRNLPQGDKAMMLYIFDIKSGDVFEYHADTPRYTTTSGANITDDTSRPCG